MRYSRVLTLLALLGVVGLTATLLGRSARPAPRTARAAAVRPAPRSLPAPASASTLRGLLNQELQQLLGSFRLARTPPRVPLALSQGGTCFVSGCSENPCIVFTQSGAPPAGSVSNGVLIASAPTVSPVPLARSACARRAKPSTQRVSVATPIALAR
jgi:hypothetical protein